MFSSWVAMDFPDVRPAGYPSYLKAGYRMSVQIPIMLFINTYILFS